MEKNSKRIAYNTIMLYIRMLLIMLVSLYTSRIVLQVLGVEDYGIYNVVAGVVVMLNFLNSALNVSTQRFLNYEMGKGNLDRLQKIFSTSLLLYFIIAVIVLLFSETVGIWFVGNVLTIPSDRVVAAIWVFQFSILSFIINLITVPYNATIIAHEKMSIYALFSIVEAVLRLILVFFLTKIPTDKLILYSALMTSVQCTVLILYIIYCKRHFDECRLVLVWDKSLLKGLSSFSGWIISSTITNMLSTQGVNILINLFFGPTFNAARGIAMQVYAAVGSFLNNFITAVRPQIYKSYAQNDVEYMYKLVFSSSKIAFYLLFILSLPILINTHDILKIWLSKVPDYAVIFTQLILVDLLITSIYSSVSYVSQASGKVKVFQIVISVGYSLIAILTWVAYKIGFAAESTFIIAIIVDFVGIFARIAVLKRITEFSTKKFLINVMYPIFKVVISTSMLCIVMYYIITDESSLQSLALRILWCLISSGLMIWIWGINKSERKLLKNGIGTIMSKVRR